LPFKLYAYSRIGRCIVTAKSECTDYYAGELENEPWLAIPGNDPLSLATAVTELADNPELREDLAKRSAIFYSDYLSNEISQQTILESLFPRREGNLEDPE